MHTTTLVINLIITVGITATDGKVLVCYIMFWSSYRQNDGMFSLDYIDPRMCTHIIYGYNTIKSMTQQIIPLDPSADYTPGLGNIEKLVGMKVENPYLKILVSVGGWSEGSEMFSYMVHSEVNRTKFINEAVKFIGENQIDGLDLDWQYPTQRGGKEEDRDNFPTLLEELRKAFDPRGYILTTRLVAMRYVMDPGYKVERISKAVHYINMRTFAYHGQWEPRTGVYAPLAANDEFSLEFSVHYILKKGAQPEKLLLGIRPGGTALLMTNSSSDTGDGDRYLQAPTTGPFFGTLTNEPGFFGYNDYCWERSMKQPWREFWDNVSSTPYSVLGKKFISFDNIESVKLKLKLVDLNKLGGVNIYSIDTDDFKGFCNSKPFPITYTVRNFLFGQPPPIMFTTSIISHNYPDAPLST